MGYCITSRKYDEINDDNIMHTDIIESTEEEMRIAQLAFQAECNDALTKLKETLPNDLATRIYLRFLGTIYVRHVQEWMNTLPFFFGRNHRPSDVEDAIRIISTRQSVLDLISDYQNGKEMKNREYFLYKFPDEIIEKHRESIDKNSLPSEDGLLPAGSNAFIRIDFERVVPVTITDRKGFLYYCAATADGHEYILPSNQLFETEKEATAKINERNSRRAAAIEKYHLLEQSEDENINKDRKTTLEWLEFNQGPLEPMEERLLKYVS